MSRIIEEIDGRLCTVSEEVIKKIVTADGYAYTIHSATFSREYNDGSGTEAIVFVEALKCIFENKVQWKARLDCVVLSDGIYICGKMLVVPSKWDLKIFNRLTGEIIFSQEA